MFVPEYQSPSSRLSGANKQYCSWDRFYLPYQVVAFISAILGLTPVSDYSLKQHSRNFGGPMTFVLVPFLRSGLVRLEAATTQ